MGGHPDGFEERDQGCRASFVGGLLLSLVEFRASVLIFAGLVAGAWSRRRFSCGATWERRTRRPSFVTCSQQSGGEPARGGAGILVRFPRRMVRRWLAGLPVHHPGLELLAGRRVYGRLGDRIRGRAGQRRRTFLRRFYSDPGSAPDGKTATWLAFLLGAFPAAIAVALLAHLPPAWVVVIGLIAFGVVFAAQFGGPFVPDPRVYRWRQGGHERRVYYMANACGRLGILFGLLYQYTSLAGCLWASAALAAITGIVSLLLPSQRESRVTLAAVGGDE